MYVCVFVCALYYAILSYLMIPVSAQKSFIAVFIQVINEAVKQVFKLCMPILFLASIFQANSECWVLFISSNFEKELKILYIFVIVLGLPFPMDI